MKCQNANNYFFYALPVIAAFTIFTASARIENTIIANYDLEAGTSAHYEMMFSPPGKNTTVTLIPLDTNKKTPSIFKISACVNRYSGAVKQGEFRFSGAETDQNDLRLSNLGSFVNEHNLRTWWIHLNKQQNLLFNQDVGGLIVSDPSSFSFTAKACQPD